MPDGMQKITSFSIGDIDRPSCYSGEAYAFAATDLSTNEIANFYQEYFAERDLDLTSRLNERFYFAATSKQKADAGRAVEGFAIQICGDECLARYEFSKSTIVDAQKEFKDVYVLYTWFVPYEVRDNLCWCCSGG
ncbi:MAG: hypothetical protein EHM33_23565 [Chloroflexi bacterium]|nr:MAG: hypothetical protein EHM33_23565 [Chloroflexota bacterium]